MLSRIVAIVVLFIFIGNVTGESSTSGSGQINKDISSTNDASVNSSCDPYCNYSDFLSFDHKLGNLTSNGLINITTDVMLLSIVRLEGLENISIIGYDNPTVNCNNTGGIHLDNCHNCTIVRITWEKCGSKNNNIPAIKLYNSSNVIIRKCFFQHSAAQAIALSEMSGDVSISDVIFEFNNHFEGHGAAIYYLSKIKHLSKFQLTISNCNFTHNGASINDSVVYISPSNNKSLEQVHLTNSVFLSNQGTPLYISHQNVLVSGNMLFEGNEGNQGGGIFTTNHSNIIFQNSDSIKFINNKALCDGGALYIHHSNVVFTGKFTLTIVNNQARNGGGFYILENSIAVLKGSSKVTINNNMAENGGAFNVYNSNVTFEENSMVTINSNQASYGGGLRIRGYSEIKFKASSRSIVKINNNIAEVGGALVIIYNSNVAFEGNYMVAINSNQARYGGGLYISWNSNITVNSTVKINSNQAKYGGGFYIQRNCEITVEGSSTVMINDNKAEIIGGAINVIRSSDVMFKGNCTVTMINNQATLGGSYLIWDNSTITFTGDSMTVVTNNQATFGGAFYIWDNSGVSFKRNSKIMINNNHANSDGGALYIMGNSNVIFEESSIVTINNNQAESDGGTLYIRDSSDAVFKGNTTVIFQDNRALLNGGAFYSYNSNITMTHSSTIVLANNTAENGGAVFVTASTLLVSGYSNVTIGQNNAQDGGGIFFNDQNYARFKNLSTVTIIFNTADNVGGAVYSKITQTTDYFNISEISFSDNTAGVLGDLLYLDVSQSCNSSCLKAKVVGVSNETVHQDLSDENIATSPSTLKFYDPARCISNDNIGCVNYYINNIMLGQEIPLNPCLLDYYNKPAEVTQFRITSSEENQKNYLVSGPDYASILCNYTINGISVIGSKAIYSPLNYSIFFTSFATRQSARKVISVNLTVQLSPCHPGFQHQNNSQKCECYNNRGIVLCSSSSSTIARGYWFGHVNGIPTVTFCPINYCNFTCCRTTNGYYYLSPVRANQCRLHRTGMACGNCDNGYTLPYYSSECVSVDQCTTGWTALIVILTVLYWIGIFIAVFVLMHYQISIGYLYAITYYYSIVDALLNESVDDLPDGLYIFANIMYSSAELTPQFLGKLCLMKNMSGIDQQFIHYMHPLAISLILVIITLAARCSRRVSAFISRGIIHVICFLLLLSYTSMTTTSLLLLRYLTFFNVNKVYTQLSPEIEYFHGRHLAYGIIALLCTITIVVGLPLLLLLQPFLNGKINFIKLKPLLDQFQGCFKDKFRWFAAYYMICRLAIITITIIFSTNDVTAQYLLITVCAAVVLVHLVVRPYNATVLNILDGILLLLLVLTTVLLLVEFTESSLAIQVTLLLLILPLILVGLVCLLTYKGTVKRFLLKLFKKKCPKKVDDHDNYIEMPTSEFDTVVDESVRRNTTTCVISDSDVDSLTGVDVTCYRDSLLAINIED